MSAPVLGRMAIPLLAIAPLLSACGGVPGPARYAADAPRAEDADVGPRTLYGPALALGQGQVRSYLVTDGADGAPVELGVSMDSAALEGLPASEPIMLMLELPSQAPEPYRFTMLDWNPHGHEPPGIYDHPHFDFHFYAANSDEVMAISPDDASFAEKANRLPEGEDVPEHYVVFVPPDLTPADVAVPSMGVHWVDTRAPELQGMFGNPDGYKPFTATFIYGSWDGRLTFYEPMITRAHLLTRPDEIRPVPRPVRYAAPGWYPGAYRVAWDAGSKQYRIALTQLSMRN
jgi:hypothetical protein